MKSFNWKVLDSKFTFVLRIGQTAISTFSARTHLGPSRERRAEPRSVQRSEAQAFVNNLPSALRRDSTSYQGPLCQTQLQTLPQHESLAPLAFTSPFPSIGDSSQAMSPDTARSRGLRSTPEALHSQSGHCALAPTVTILLSKTTSAWLRDSQGLDGKVSARCRAGQPHGKLRAPRHMCPWAALVEAQRAVCTGRVWVRLGPFLCPTCFLDV